MGAEAPALRGTHHAPSLREAPSQQTVGDVEHIGTPQVEGAEDARATLAVVTYGRRDVCHSTGFAEYVVENVQVLVKYSFAEP